MIDAAVDDLAPLIGELAACRALGACRSSRHRRKHPSAPRPARPRQTPDRALSEAERDAVLAQLHSLRFVDASPAEVYATLLDEGVYLASQRTMYRLLAAHGENRERRDQRTHPPYQRPELLACAPNELWSWDISKLLGPAKWTYFYLYAILDVHSRYIVGWTVAHRESAALAKALIADTIQKQQIPDGQWPMHCPSGAADQLT